MTVALIVLAVFSALMLLANLHALRRQRGADRSRVLIESWFESTPPSAESVKAYSEFRRTMQLELSWYQRSLSTFGVIAFVSMTVAAAIQTVRANKEQMDAEALRKENTQIEAQVSSIAKDMAIQMQSEYLTGVRPNDTEKQLLRYRLNELARQPITLDIARERFDAAIMLDDHNAALSAYASYPKGVDVRPEDRVRLAEGALMMGNPIAARALFLGLLESSVQLDKSLRARVIILETALDPEKLRAEEYAALKGISPIEARTIIGAKSRDLRGWPRDVSKKSK